MAEALSLAFREMLVDALRSPEVCEQLRAIMRQEFANAAPRQAPSPAGPLLSVGKAAAHAGVNEATIRGWIARGKLRAKRAGNRWRIGPGDLEVAMAAPSKPNGTRRPIDLDAEAARIIALDRQRRR